MPRLHLPRPLAIAVGACSFILGVVLVTRPLTSIVALCLAIAAGFVISAIVIVRRSRRPFALVTAAMALVGAVAAVVFLREVAYALPDVAALVLLGTAAVLAVRIVRTGPLSARITRTLLLLAACAAAGFCWWLPDVALIALGASFALGLVIVGVVVVIRAVRSRRGRASAVISEATNGGLADGTPDAPVTATQTSASRARPVLRVVGAALVFALAGGALWGAQTLAPLEARDAFYDWQDPVPAEAGALLRVGPYEGEAPAGSTAVRILYATTYADGSPAVASAVVAIPDAAPTPDADGERPVLAWQHGTTGVGRECAPSLQDDALSEVNIPGISRAIERGWLVVATDYPGQGTDGPYPYLIGEGEGRATLDAVRAASALDDARASNQVMLWGHSQGGHATLWAGALAAAYAPELEVVSVAALSAAADPLALAQGVLAKKGNLLGGIITACVLAPYADAYDDVDLSALVHPAGERVVETFTSRCVTSTSTLVSVLMSIALAGDTPLYRIDVEDGPVRDRLAQNIASGDFDAPLFLGQGTADEVVSIEIQRAFAERRCADGRPAEVHEYAGATHLGVIAEGAPLIDDLYTWADAVVAGTATTPSCS